MMKIVFDRYEVLRALCYGIRPFQEIRLEFNGERLRMHTSWGDYYFNAEGDPGILRITNYDLRDLLGSATTQFVQLAAHPKVTVKDMNE